MVAQNLFLTGKEALNKWIWSSIWWWSIWMQSICRRSICRQSICRWSICRRSIGRLSIYWPSICRWSICMQSIRRRSICRRSISRWSGRRWWRWRLSTRKHSIGRRLIGTRLIGRRSIGRQSIGRWLLMMQSIGRCDSSWDSILWCTHSHANVESSVQQCPVRNERYDMTDWPGAGDSQSWVDTALSWCCIWYMVILVYAVLRVNWWLWHGKIERENVLLYSQLIFELRTREQDMKADLENQHVKLELKRILCTGQLAIPNSEGKTPDPVDQYTDLIYSSSNQVCYSTDFQHPLVWVRLFLSSSPISRSCP